MITIVWSNGKVDRAPTWELLEELIRNDQWRGYTPIEFREAMAKRAWRWAGVRIDIETDALGFFHELMYAKLIVIEHETKGKGGEDQGAQEGAS